MLTLTFDLGQTIQFLLEPSGRTRQRRVSQTHVVFTKSDGFVNENDDNELKKQIIDSENDDGAFTDETDSTNITGLSVFFSKPAETSKPLNLLQNLTHLPEDEEQRDVTATFGHEG